MGNVVESIPHWMVSLTMLLNRRLIKKTSLGITCCISLENKLVVHLRDDVVDLDSHLVPGHQVDHLGVGSFLQSDDSD